MAAGASHYGGSCGRAFTEPLNHISHQHFTLTEAGASRPAAGPLFTTGSPSDQFDSSSCNETKCLNLTVTVFLISVGQSDTLSAPKALKQTSDVLLQKQTIDNNSQIFQQTLNKTSDCVGLIMSLSKHYSFTEDLFFVSSCFNYQSELSVFPRPQTPHSHILQCLDDKLLSVFYEANTCWMQLLKGKLHPENNHMYVSYSSCDTLNS